jgi:hypothetical protein
LLIAALVNSAGLTSIENFKTRANSRTCAAAVLSGVIRRRPSGRPRSDRGGGLEAVKACWHLGVYEGKKVRCGALRSLPSERTTFGTCEGNEGKRIRHGEQA